MTPHLMAYSYWCFWGAYCFCFQGLGLLIAWIWRQQAPLKCQLLFPISMTSHFKRLESSFTLLWEPQISHFDIFCDLL